MSAPTFLETLRREVSRMQASHPEREGEISRACALITMGMVTVEDGENATVLSSDGQQRYAVNGQCSCQAGQHGRGCKHVHAVKLWRYVQRKVDAQILKEIGNLPDSFKTDIAPSLDPRYIIHVHGKPFVRYAGLLALAHQRGLQKLEVTFISVTPELAVAQATATFADGRVFTEVADATPTNVNKGGRAALCALCRHASEGPSLARCAGHRHLYSGRSRVILTRLRKTQSSCPGRPASPRAPIITTLTAYEGVYQMRTTIIVSTILLTLALPAIGQVPTAPGQPIICGAHLGPGGYYQLEEDLDCHGQNISLRDGAILNLNGHQVTCDFSTFYCLHLTGHSAQVWNGVVKENAHWAIRLAGTGGHLVWNMTSLLTDANVLVESDRNRLIHVHATSVYSPAFHFVGNHNQLLRSTAHCPHVEFGACITVSGDDNRLIGNTVMHGPQSTAFWTGIAVDGDRNYLLGNHIQGEGPESNDTGLIVSGSANVLLGNRIEGNERDVEDLNGDCTHNAWHFNAFTTADPACLLDPRPGVEARHSHPAP